MTCITIARNGCLLAAATLLAAPGAQAAGEYRIAPGDMVEVAVAGVPALQRIERVQADGTVPLFGAGSVKVAGLDPAGLQARAATLLSSHVLRYRLPDGHEKTLLARPGEVVATIVKYRPVYVIGAVAAPGQQEYRPSMTVLQAVAGVGGYGGGRAGDPVALDRDRRTASLEYLKEYFLVARTEAELKGNDKFEAATPAEVEVPAATAAAMAHAESDLMRSELADYASERGFLERAAKRSEAQIAVLKRQEEVEKKAVAEDAKDLDRLQKLLRAGTATTSRVTDARRSLLLSSMRELQTTVNRMRLERVRDDFRRQIAALANKRQIKLLTDLAAARPRLLQLQASLRATQSEMARLSGSAGLRPSIIIRRADGSVRRRFAAKEDTVLQPGDVVEIAFISTMSGQTATADATVATGK